MPLRIRCPRLSHSQYEQNWKERSIQIERFLRVVLNASCKCYYVKMTKDFSRLSIPRFPTRHRRIIMVRRLTIGRCPCLAKRKAKKSAKKKAKRSVRKKQKKPKKETVPKVTMPESPPLMASESTAPPVEPAPSQTPPSESGTGTSS